MGLLQYYVIVLNAYCCLGKFNNKCCVYFILPVVTGVLIDWLGGSAANIFGSSCPTLATEVNRHFLEKESGDVSSLYLRINLAKLLRNEHGLPPPPPPPTINNQ